MNHKSIKLSDILKFSDEELREVKIRLCSPPTVNKANDPIEAFKENPDNVAIGWVLWRFTKYEMYHPGNITIGLCRLADDPDRWLLTTVKTITKDLGVLNGVGYEGEEWSKYVQYYGRVIVHYHRKNQYLILNGVRNGINRLDGITVEQILPDIFEDDHFPGYDHISLTYSKLKRIVDCHLDDWFNALANQKGVYVITDLNTGKLYVGSATSEKGMLLKRWTDYVDTLHGGDVGLKKLIKEKGKDYIPQYFQYTLLENFNQREPDENIYKRENWWKDVLASRDFGYNGN